MYRNNTISLVIPSMNERKGLEIVFPSIPAYIDEVIIVDYKSTDGTPEYAKNMGARVIHEDQKGYGAAYKRGFRMATGDIIVTSDADGTYPITAAAELIDYMLDNNLNFVSGCRFPLKDQNSMRKRNFIGNMLLTSVSVMLFGYKVTDLLSGMWVFKKDVLNHLKIRTNGWNFSEEITIEAIIRKNVRFGEYHINYFEREGQTKLWPFTVGVENLCYLFLKKLFVFFDR